MADFTARLRRVDHTWPSSGVHACRNVNLTLERGSIHALVGENGAGKTTLGHILSGIRAPDSGNLEFEENILNLAQRKGEAINGIGLIRQHSIWPKELKIWEAAVFGRKGRGLRKKDVLKRFSDTASTWGLGDIDPTLSISGLNTAMLQRAELTAVLMFEPALLVLDEPTSAWEEGRGEEFQSLMDGIRNQELTLLLITHRIDDVFRYADSVTVMRRGNVKGTWSTGEINKEKIITEMFGEASVFESDSGHEVDSPSAIEYRENGTGHCLCADSLNLSIAGRRILKDISFEVKSGEVLAITGLREEGLGALEDMVTGSTRSDSGRVLINGQPAGSSPSSFRRSGMRYIPSDKTGRGASLESTMAENMLILNSRRLSHKGILWPSRMNRWTDVRRENGGIDGNPEQILGELSGGNIQKVILEREFHGRVPVIVAADPTWGLDERSRLSVHQRIRRNAEEGAAVLLLASDLDEALENADRLAVISSGSLSAARPVKDWTRTEIAGLIASAGSHK